MSSPSISAVDAAEIEKVVQAAVAKYWPKPPAGGFVRVASVLSNMRPGTSPGALRNRSYEEICRDAGLEPRVNPINVPGGKKKKRDMSLVEVRFEDLPRLARHIVDETLASKMHIRSLAIYEDLKKKVLPKPPAVVPAVTPAPTPVSEACLVEDSQPGGPETPGMVRLRTMIAEIVRQEIEAALRQMGEKIDVLCNLQEVQVRQQFLTNAKLETVIKGAGAKYATGTSPEPAANDMKVAQAA